MPPIRPNRGRIPRQPSPNLAICVVSPASRVVSPQSRGSPRQPHRIVSPQAARRILRLQTTANQSPGHRTPTINIANCSKPEPRTQESDNNQHRKPQQTTTQDTGVRLKNNSKPEPRKPPKSRSYPPPAVPKSRDLRRIPRQPPAYSALPEQEAASEDGFSNNWPVFGEGRKNKRASDFHAARRGIVRSLTSSWLG